MNDEINHEVANKTVAIVFRASALTSNTLSRAFRAYLNSRNRNANKSAHHGKMKVKDLLGQDQGAVSIDIGDGKLREFSKVVKKYNVDFAIKKDKSGEIPKYTVFFKARDKEVIAHALDEFVKNNEAKAKRPSMKKRLEAFKEIAAISKVKERTIDKIKNRDIGL